MGYTSVDLSQTVIVLATKTQISHCVWCVLYLINIILLKCSKIYFYCAILRSASFVWYRIFIFMESWFILMVFIWYPKVRNWINHQFFNLHLSDNIVHDTQKYKSTYIETQDTMGKNAQRKKIILWVSIPFSRTCQS